MTIAVKDANGSPQTVKTIDDLVAVVSLAAKQDTGNGTLASILAKITADPATAAGQAAIIAAIGDIPGGEGGGGDATAANQTSQITQETAINTVLGTKADAKSAATDTTAASAISIFKQISEYLKSLGATADNKSTATDTTAVSGISLWKQISASVQAAATVFGAKTDAKSTATDATSISFMQVFKQISASLQAGLNIFDGTNAVKVRAGSSAAVAADNALVVALRPDSIKDTYAEYETVAASQTDQVLGATGAVGDYLAGVLIIPGTAGCGAVSIKDGNGSSITIFAGGGTTALPTLAPIFVPLGIYSVNGTSAGWRITTGANVTAMGIGDFT